MLPSTNSATPAALARRLVQDVEYDPTGRWITGAVVGGGIVVWDTERDETVEVDAHDVDTINVAFSPDGSMLLSTAPLADETTIWRFDDGELTESETVSNVLFHRGGAFSPDGRFAAFGVGQGGDVVLIDLREDGSDGGDRMRVLAVDDGTLDATWEVVFHPTEPLLASVGADGLVHFWDLDAFEETGEPLVGHRDAVGDMTFLGDGRRVLTASEDGTIRLWDLERREPIGTPLVGHEGTVHGLTADKSGLAAISGSSDGTIIFWDLDVEHWIAEGCDLVGRDLTDTERQRFDLEGAPRPC